MLGVMRMLGNWKRKERSCKWLRDDSDRGGCFEYCKKARRKVVCWGMEGMCEFPRLFKELGENKELEFSRKEEVDK